MHNKLLLSDGAVAVFGVRNIATEYFLLNVSDNYIDLDTMAVGPVVNELARNFDAYWNRDQAYLLTDLTPDAPPDALVVFERANRAGLRPLVEAFGASGLYGDSPLAADLDAGLPGLVWTPAEANSNLPGKVERHGKRRRGPRCDGDTPERASLAGCQGRDCPHHAVLRSRQAAS